MNRILQVFFMALICFSSCKKKPESVVASDMKHYEEINKKQKDYTKKHVDDITSAAGGTITGFYRDDEIKKIVSEHYTDTCRIFTEYYFDGGMLIFILRQNYAYNRPVTYTEDKAKEKGDSVWYDDKKTKLEISRFFFGDNKLVKWIQPDNTAVSTNSWAFTNKEAALWAETVVLMKELKEQ